MSAFGQLRVCSAGVVAVVTAMVLPVLLGFVSLGTEVGHWYLAQREMQGAADAAAISAAAEYISQVNAGNPTSTTYQTVGESYAAYNGFTIPTSNVCLVSSSTNNCASVLALDSRAISTGCTASNVVCVVVEVTQDTMTWLTRKMSLEPVGHSLRVQSIPGPTLKARAVVSMNVTMNTVTTSGTDCVLALANDPAAITVGGNGDLVARCGVSIDGGLTQNPGTPARGGIIFNGNGKAEVNSLVVATNTKYAQECTGPKGDPCYLWSAALSPPNGGGSTTHLCPNPPSCTVYLPNTATADPYASQISQLFQTGGAAVPPLGVQTGGVVRVAQGTGYTPNGTCTFTVSGGTGTPAKFTATVSGGKVTTIATVIDPGAYTVFPTNPVLTTSNCGGGSGATFTLTEGCFTWVVPPIAGRKYCSVNLNGAGTTNFPGGNYWIAGGDSNCAGFCVSSANATVTSDVAGVTFFLTNGDGSHSLGTTSYAIINITSGSVSLCAPGTGCGTKCTGTGTTSCMLFIQNPAATTGNTLASTPANTFQGNGTRNFSGLIYIPKQEFSTSGVGAFKGCVGIIAKYLSIIGTPQFADGCLPGHGIGGTTTTTTSLTPPALYQ